MGREGLGAPSRTAACAAVALLACVAAARASARTPSSERVAAGSLVAVVPDVPAAPVTVTDSATGATWRFVAAGERPSGLIETWSADGDALRHAVLVESDAFASLGAGGSVAIAWSMDRGQGTPLVQLETRVPVDAWLRAGAPPVLEVHPTAVELQLPRDDRPSPRATADCPDDLAVQCDGAGNVVARQAWLDSFGGTPSPGCGVASVSTSISPGVVLSDIRYDDFRDTGTLTLNGTTGIIGNPVLSGGRWVLRLTNGLTQAGSAFVTNPVTLASDASFSAFFTFRISAPQGISDIDGAGADGLVFVVQTVANTAGGTGGGIGYQGIPSSMGIEMDSWDNGGWDDFDGNHVGIDLSGSVDSVVQAPLSPRLNDGAIWNAWVDYDGARDLLEARVSTSATRPAAPQVSLTTDLTAVLGSTNAFVGFTSGCGAAGGDHDILSFYFQNTRQPFGCGGTGTETVTSTVTDDCGNTAGCTRIFTIEDTAPPSLTAGALPPCILSVAEAETAVLAATSVSEACSPPASISVTTLGTCDAIVRLTATDECGNVATLDYPVRVDPLGPLLAATTPATGCATILHATAGLGGNAIVAPAAAFVDTCGSTTITNDRTAGGADATDTYPCGFTVVTFDAVDECGRTDRCRVGVLVEPSGPPPDVGPALRVRKSAGGWAGTPVLDWSLCGAPPGSPFKVLVAEDDPSNPWLRPSVGVLGTAWIDAAAPTPSVRLVCYDVRAEDCLFAGPAP